MSTIRYDIGPTLDQEPELRLLYVSVAEYSREWNSLPHSHPCTEIFFITGGAGYLILGSRAQPLCCGDVVLLGPGVEHTEVSSPHASLKYIVLGVAGLEVRDEDACPGCAILSIPPGDLPEILFREIVKEVQRQEQVYEKACQGLLKVLLIHLGRRGKSVEQVEIPDCLGGMECAVVRRYIEVHFKEKLSLDELAALVHVSRFHLCRSFALQFGVSPIRYALECRIRESRHLLVDTRFTLTEIAGLLGFSSPSYFSQTFRRLTGMTPGEFRRGVRRGKDEEKDEEKEN